MRASAVLFAAVCSLVLRAESAESQPSTVILVRHAERAAAPAADPVLTEAGSRRAQALKAALASAGVSVVVATHLQRTQLTAKPLSDSLKLSPIIVRAGNPLAAHLDSVAATVRRQPAGSVVLVVGHSNTIPKIVAALGGPVMPDLCETQYASLYILQFHAPAAPRLIRASYGAADAWDGGDCDRAMRP